MEWVVYGLPNCSVCHGIHKRLTSAVGRGKLSGEVHFKLIEPEETSMEERIACSENFSELAMCGLAPPALVLYGQGGEYQWGLGEVLDLRRIKLHELQDEERSCKEGKAGSDASDTAQEHSFGKQPDTVDTSRVPGQSSG